MLKVDVAVIGGGAAGLAAAIKAKELDAGRVLIIERNEELGGILPQCIHTGFGLHYFGENLTGPEYISRFIEKALEVGVEFMTETAVLRLTASREVMAVNRGRGMMEIRAGAVVLAMGCRERSRGALSIPGTRPAGIYTAGTVQRLMDVDGYLPGEKAVILGSGDVGLIVARRLAMEGVKVEAVVEKMPYPGGLTRNVVQCLEDFGIPLLLEHTVTKIHGAERVEAVTIKRLDGSGRLIKGSGRLVSCDTLILSVGLIPENELSEDAGILIDPATGGPVVDERMETSIPGIFACGNVVHVNDLVDHVTWSGELAGESAALHVHGMLKPLKRRIRVKAGLNVRYVVSQIIGGENPVRMYLRVQRPMRDVWLRVGGFRVFRRVVRPPEVVVLKLEGDRLLKAVGEAEELVVDVEKD